MRSRILFLFLLLALPIGLFAESAGDKAFKRGEYKDAIESYSKALRKGKMKPEERAYTKFRIGEAYRKMNNVPEAIRFLGEAIEADGYSEPEAYFSYGDVLQMQGNYAKAKNYFELYAQKNPRDMRVKARISSCDFAVQNQRANPNASLDPLTSVNTTGSEFGVAYKGENLIYSSTGSPTSSKNISSRTGLPFSKMYESRFINGTYYPGSQIKGLNMDKMSNDGSFSYDERSGRGYYTRCVSGSSDCYVYFAEFNNGEWKEKGRLKIDNKKSSVGHPCITPDGKRLYFTSSMPGGMGGTDIWYMDNMGGDKWSPAKNAGKNVNTAGNEGFPYVQDSLLYFASDGHVGYGGLDLFVSRIDTREHTPAVNLRPPYNSSYDDFNLIINKSKDGGITVSSRNGNDDMYYYQGEPGKIMIASGEVKQEGSEEPVPNAMVTLQEGDEKIVDSMRSDEKGRFYTYVSPDKNYTLAATHPEYNSSAQKVFSTVGINYPVEMNKSTGHDLDMYLSVGTSQISGVVFDAQTGMPMEGQVAVLYINDFEADQAMCNQDGVFQFDNIMGDAVYRISVEREGYEPANKTLRIDGPAKPMTYSKATGYDADVPLIKIMFDGKEIDLGKEYNIGNIYYAFNRWDLLPESKKVLASLIAFMNRYPSIRVQISSHTDSRGADAYNLNLSQRRAKSVVDYMISQGVSRDRLTWVGYGESRPVIANARTEAEHALNRRTSFMVNGMVDNVKIEKSTEEGTRVAQPIEGGPSTSSSAPRRTSTVQQGGAVASTPVVSSSPNAGGNLDHLRVQVAASRRQIPNNARIKIAENAGYKVEMKKYADGYYRYFVVGEYSTPEQARTVIAKLKAAGISDCFARQE